MSGAAATALAPPLGEGEPLAAGYEVIEHLSRNLALDVYDVWSEERDCRCVAKVLRPDRRADGAARRRLLDEGRLLERLSHPHIVRAYETLEEPEPIVILETLGGETVSHLVETRRQRLPAVDLAFLGLHLCSAMHYLHRHGTLHLDLKPSNVISDRGHAKVLDLSLARPPGPCPAGLGTREYMAPEQAAGGTVGEASDVWGIGAVLYRAATRQRPYEAWGGVGDHPQLERRPAPVAAHRRLAPVLAAAIDACLELVPESRPSLAELSATLEELVPEG